MPPAGGHSPGWEGMEPSRTKPELDRPKCCRILSRPSLFSSTTIGTQGLDTLTWHFATFKKSRTGALVHKRQTIARIRPDRPRRCGAASESRTPHAPGQPLKRDDLLLTSGAQDT
jgi:hypothetical protein